MFWRESRAEKTRVKSTAAEVGVDSKIRPTKPEKKIEITRQRLPAKRI